VQQPFLIVANGGPNKAHDDGLAIAPLPSRFNGRLLGRVPGQAGD
jgi:hypothetical protein